MTSVAVHDDAAGVRWVTFDRPAKLNAVTLDDLVAVADGLAEQPPRAVVLTGAGDRAFTAGLDTASFEGLDRQGARTFLTRLRDAVAVLRTAPVPTVAAINGYCYGIGFELALCCDLRLATPSTRCAMPEIRLGFPSVIDAALLHHYLGLSLAKEMVLTGRPCDVADLERSGVLNRVVAPESLREEAERAVAALVELDADAYASQKRLVQAWLDEPFSAVVDRSVGEFADRF